MKRLESPLQLEASQARRARTSAATNSQMIAALVLSALASVASLFSPKLTAVGAGRRGAQQGSRRLLGLHGRHAIVGIILIEHRVHHHPLPHHGLRSARRSSTTSASDLFAHLQQLPFSYYDSRPAGKILVRVINYVNSVSDIAVQRNHQHDSGDHQPRCSSSSSCSTTDVDAGGRSFVAGLPVFVFIVLMLKPRQRRAWQEQSNKNSNYNAYLAECIDGVQGVSQLFDRQEVNIEHHAASWPRPAAGRGSRRVYISNAVWLHSASSLTQIVLHPPVHRGGLLDRRRRHGLLRRDSGHGPVRGPASGSPSPTWPTSTTRSSTTSPIWSASSRRWTSRWWWATRPTPRRCPPISGEVEFRDVTFAYRAGHRHPGAREPARPARARASRWWAPPGAGKSTVVNLLQPLLQPERRRHPADRPGRQRPRHQSR